MKPVGPMTEAVLRSRKLQAQAQAVADALTVAFQSAADAELPRSVLAALVRLKEEGKPKQGDAGFLAEHWLAYQILFGPAVLSAATLRAARIVEGTSGSPVVIGLPRRANDYPEVTAVGLRFFYQACLGHAKPGAFGGLGELFENLRLDGLMQGQPMQPSLADALLLGLLPGLSAQAQGLLLSGEEHHAELVRDLLGMADLLVGLRLGRLPTSLPEGQAGLARALLETEAVHGLFLATLRANVSKVGAAENWPPLVAAFVDERRGPGAMLATHPVPLFVCTLAAAWLKLTYRGQASDVKVAVLGEFKALIARCPHPQAAALERMLNSAIA
jgi:hypothetical protein